MSYITPHQWACISLARARGYFKSRGKVWIMSPSGDLMKAKINTANRLQEQGWHIIRKLMSP